MRCSQNEEVTKPRCPLIGSQHQGTRGRVEAPTAGPIVVWTGFFAPTAVFVPVVAPATADQHAATSAMLHPPAPAVLQPPALAVLQPPAAAVLQLLAVAVLQLPAAQPPAAAVLQPPAAAVSQSLVGSPEESIRPLPLLRVNVRKAGRKKGRSKMMTSSPERTALEDEQQARRARGKSGVHKLDCPTIERHPETGPSKKRGRKGEEQ